MKILSHLQILLSSSLSPFSEYSVCPYGHIDWDIQIPAREKLSCLYDKEGWWHFHSLQVLDHSWIGMEVQFVSVKTSVWYSVEHQQKLKVFFSSTFQKMVIPFLIIPFAYNGADSFPSNDMWLGLAVIGYAPPPYIFSNFLPHTDVTECSFSMNTVWDCILVFFNTSSCSYSLIHSCHLVMVLFGKRWAKMSLYISSAHWTLKSLCGRTPPLGFPYSTLMWFFPPFYMSHFTDEVPNYHLESVRLCSLLCSISASLSWAGLRETWKGVKEFEFKF